MELSSEDAEIPIPINSVYGGGIHGHGHSHGHHGQMTRHHHHHHNYHHQQESHPHPPSSPPHHHHQHHHTIIPPPSSSASPPHHHHEIIPTSSNISPINNNGTSTAATTTTTVPNLEDNQQEVPYNSRESAPKNNKVIRVIRYRECQKNHAASMGGNATDGCGEFMPSGEEGTLEFLTCSVCNCHRNFHRREIEGGGNEYPPVPPPPLHPLSYHSTPHHLRGRKVIFSGTASCGGGGGGGQGLSGYPTGVGAGVSLVPAGSRAVTFKLPYSQYQVGPPGGSGAPSASDDQSDDHGGVGPGGHQMVVMKKRFRTKFSQEQKEKMLEFAEKVGWKIQKQEEAVVQKFCQEVGVKRRVLKVWMHNNKHTLAKKNLPNMTNDSSSLLN